MKFNFEVALLVIVLLSAGCGGSSSDSQDSGLPSVSGNESPVSNSSGIRLSLADGSNLYLLVEENQPSEHLDIQLFSVPEADMSQTLGETFYEFVSPNTGHAFGVLETDAAIVSVSACYLEEQRCRETPMTTLTENSFSFDVRPNYKYAFDIQEDEL